MYIIRDATITGFKINRAIISRYAKAIFIEQRTYYFFMTVEIRGLILFEGILIQTCT